MTEFQTKHKLDFEVAPWAVDPNYQRFRIGTCNGLWGVTDDAYLLLAIKNNLPGNGHLEDVFEWFEHSCERDNKDFIIQEIWNSGFGKNLFSKRGFVHHGKDDAIKRIKRKLRT